MISVRRGASGHLGSYETRVSVGATEQPVATPASPQVVTGPAGAQETRIAAQRSDLEQAMLCLALVGVMGVAGYTGYAAARRLQGRAA